MLRSGMTFQEVLGHLRDPHAGYAPTIATLVAPQVPDARGTARESSRAEVVTNLRRLAQELLDAADSIERGSA